MSRIVALLERPLVIRGEALRPLDAIVVLGAPLRDDALTPVLIERIDAAAALYHAGGAPFVIASGGITRAGNSVRMSTRAEAEVMAEGLRARGVHDVLVEDRSQTTADNARMTAALLGVPPSESDSSRSSMAKSVWLVTQPFHGRRAARLFRKAGLDAHVWHIDDSLEYRDRGRALRWVTREYLAWASLLLRR